MRLPLAYSIGSRDETADKDEKLLNAFVESQGGRRKGDKATVTKRPGLTSRYTLTTGQGGATIGQGLFILTTPSAPGVSGTSTLIGIRGDAITRPVA
jgi:hypothetical protein